MIAGDDVSLVTSGSVGLFSDNNVGVSKLVSVRGLSLSGPGAGNYVISISPSMTANITPAPLTVTANPATMTYGGTLPTLTDTVLLPFSRKVLQKKLSSSWAWMLHKAEKVFGPVCQPKSLRES